jgi:septum formation protein
MTTYDLHLASQSPRRRELLAQIGLTPAPVAVDVDETPLPGEAPAAYVERLARAKAAAGWRRVRAEALPPLPVLGADTVVVLDGELLGKPVDESDARAMLARLAGRSHQVLTGVSVCGEAGQFAAVSVTEVTFAPLEAAAIARYCASGEPMDKAGAYGIQGRAAPFVTDLHGSYSGVVGLPLFETAALLRRFGIECP